jgi:hypothetical protein
MEYSAPSDQTRSKLPGRSPVSAISATMGKIRSESPREDTVSLRLLMLGS